jgi:hypothetical protein
VYFWRFLRLGVVAAAAYWFLFAYVHGWLFADLYPRLTRDLSVEREAFAWRAALYVVFVLLLVLVNLIFDYAKIRTVVEDRRSVLGATGAALAFLTRRGGRATALYALNGVTFAALLAIWAVVAPGADGSGAAVWMGFALAQLYVLARLLLKLQFMASQVALFQASLAHAGYVAAPAVVWPESPAAESIRSG